MRCDASQKAVCPATTSPFTPLMLPPKIAGIVKLTTNDHFKTNVPKDTKGFHYLIAQLLTKLQGKGTLPVLVTIQQVLALVAEGSV